MRKDFRFGGSGGQGVISLAVLLANGLVTAFDKLPLTKRERHLVAAENAKVRAALADKLEEKALENGKGGAENA